MPFISTKLSKAYQLLKICKTCDAVSLKHNWYLVLWVLMWYMKYFKQKMASFCLLLFVLQCVPNKDVKTKHRNTWEASYPCGREASNPAVSYVRLSQFTERGRQTKLQSYVDVNESPCNSWLCCAVPSWRIVCRLPLVNLLRPSVSAVHKLDILENTTWSVKDVLCIRWLGW